MIDCRLISNENYFNYIYEENKIINNKAYM